MAGFSNLEFVTPNKHPQEHGIDPYSDIAITITMIRTFHVLRIQNQGFVVAFENFGYQYIGEDSWSPTARGSKFARCLCTIWLHSNAFLDGNSDDRSSELPNI